MDEEEVQHLRELRKIYIRNLRELQLQEAKYSIEVPIHILNGISYFKKKIEETDQQLQEIEYPTTAMTDVKYYVYISETKVDMMYSQIHQYKRLSNKEENVYSKLNLIIEHIENTARTGSVEEPKEYFKGVLEMDWGPLHSIDGEELMAYFGRSEARKKIVLVGSINFLLGYDANVREPLVSTHMAKFILACRKLNINNERGLETDINDFILEDISTMAQKMRRFSVISLLACQRLEFLAKTFVQGQLGDGTFVLLGSPIYVALAE